MSFKIYFLFSIKINLKLKKKKKDNCINNQRAEM